MYAYAFHKLGAFECFPVECRRRVGSSQFRKNNFRRDPSKMKEIRKTIDQRMRKGREDSFRKTDLLRTR
jgi:hypothetical protein